MSSPVVANNTPNGQLVDSNGRATFAFLKWMQAVAATVNQGFDSQGNYQGPIGNRATIAGRQFLATIVQKLSDAGIIDPTGLPAASPTQQGAVQLAPGSVGNTLGSAAMQATTAFDPTGAAAAAQAAAAADATTKANAAQANAEAYTDAKFAPGITTVIVTAQLTTLGSQGSMTFVDGLLTAQTQAT